MGVPLAPGRPMGGRGPAITRDRPPRAFRPAAGYWRACARAEDPTRLTLSGEGQDADQDGS